MGEGGRPQVNEERFIFMALLPNLRHCALICCGTLLLRSSQVDEGKEKDSVIELAHYQKERC